MITKAKAAFNNKKNLFYQYIGFGDEEESSKMLHLEHSFVWCWNLDVSGSRSGTPGMF